MKAHREVALISRIKVKLEARAASANQFIVQAFQLIRGGRTAACNPIVVDRTAQLAGSSCCRARRGLRGGIYVPAATRESAADARRQPGAHHPGDALTRRRIAFAMGFDHWPTCGANSIRIARASRARVSGSPVRARENNAGRNTGRQWHR